MDQSIETMTRQYYTQKLLQHGASPQGVDWNSDIAQSIRFEQLTKIINSSSSSFSICDYGCGLGDYADYLSKRFPAYDYYGQDIAEEMIEFARQKHPDGHFLISSQLNTNFDYIVASGIFNVKQQVPDPQWLDYILTTLTMFCQYANRGFAFNCLTSYSDKDHMKDYLYYADPLMLFDYCKKNFSRNVALLHDYALYDFTILVRKEGI